MARRYVPDDSIGHATTGSVRTGATLASRERDPRGARAVAVQRDREKFSRRGRNFTVSRWVSR
jgi:hypothetical protein